MPVSNQEKQNAFADLSPCFPKLLAVGFLPDDVTSEGTPIYNCIAYAAKDDTRPWWPMPHWMSSRYYYWPPHLPRQVVATKDNFLRAFDWLGYELCKTGKRERGFEKVVLYVDANDAPKHMARELGDGVWYSKLGDEQDIRHHTFDAVENQIYGVAQYFMRKRLNAPWYKRCLRKLLRIGQA